MRPSSPRAKVAPALILPLAASWAACDLLTDVTLSPGTASCVAIGAIGVPVPSLASSWSHTGVISHPTWSASETHLIIDTVFVTRALTIEPGAVVCTEPGAVLKLAPPSGGSVVVQAQGTADRRSASCRWIRPDRIS